MRGSILIGFTLGVIAILFAFTYDGGALSSILLIPAILIVFVGTLSAAISGFGISVLPRIRTLIEVAMKQSPASHAEIIVAQIVSLSIIIRRDGVLHLEQKLEEIQNLFLRKLFRLMIDGADIDTLNKVIESEVSQISERHTANISIFTKMGGYSPTMGIIGTVLGLISTLASAGSDPQILIHNIASAFIATFWGIFLANVLWLPIADKLKTLHNEEMRLYQIMQDAISSIGKGDTPSMVQARLMSYFPITRQQAIAESLAKDYKTVV